MKKLIFILIACLYTFTTCKEDSNNELNVVPVTDFSASLTIITKWQSVKFTDKSTNNPTSWFWDFGDKSTSTEQNPLHTYRTTGIYTVSLKATNDNGSNTKTLTIYITISDGILVYAGKTYHTIIINGKEWMAENLAYLPSVSPASIGSVTDPYYYVYDFNGTDVAAAKLTDNYTTYGVLYNWPAAMAACPPGWHIPSDAEWTALITFLEGKGVTEGGKLKESGYTHWLSPNTGATNEIGFAALPAGSLHYAGEFYGIGINGVWWSSTESDSVRALSMEVFYNYSDVYRGRSGKDWGYSVRCVKN